MAESTVTFDFDYLTRRAGLYLHGQRTFSGLTSTQQEDITQALQSAYQRFLTAHKWQFLRPVKTLTVWPDTTATVNGQGTFSSPDTTLTFSDSPTLYTSMPGAVLKFTTSGNEYPVSGYVSATSLKVTGDASSESADDTVTIFGGNYLMPDNFGGIDGDLAYESSNNFYPSVDLVNERQIARRRQASNVTASRPTMAAIVPFSPFDGTTGQRWQLRVFPVPDAAYTWSYRGAIYPDVVDATDVFSYGGMPHGNTLLYALLAELEATFHESENLMEQRYQEHLRQSIHFDRHSKTGESVGLNLDRSDARNFGPRSRHESTDVFVTYNGTQYGPN